jgi:hypothetical protein
MQIRPQLVLNHSRRRPKVSVILIDWGVRESFHSLHYLNRQTADRDDYELIWLEYYDRQPDGLRDMVAALSGRSPALDKWLVLGYPDDYLCHKHRVYNAGILVAEGDVCVICDSDAIFRPTFVESVIAAFAEAPRSVAHVDEVRNVDPAFYPFNYPKIEDLLGTGCQNWRDTTTLGLDDSPDPLHQRNYGACMAARRRDLIAVGGADEHLDYLGYICGPYDLTFRLSNYFGRPERWLPDEYLYHTWHPQQSGWNTEYHGPSDGMGMALLALEGRATFRVGPCLKNPWFGHARPGQPLAAEELLRLVSERPEPAWRLGAQPAPAADRVYWVERDYYGFDVFHHGETMYALRTGGGILDLRKLRRGGYREIWQADALTDLYEQMPLDRVRWLRHWNSASLPARLWRKFRSQPLRRLPARVAENARRLLVS